MAVHAHITGAPIGAPDFKLNGVLLLADEPYQFLDQAHGLACCLRAAFAEDVELNSRICEAAAGGIATLLQLAGLGLHNMDNSKPVRS